MNCGNAIATIPLFFSPLSSYFGNSIAIVQTLSLSLSLCVCVCVQLVGVSVWLVGRKSWAIISAILLLNYFCSPSLPSHHFSLLSLTFFSQFRQYQCRNSHLSSFFQITLNSAYITNKLHFIQCSTKRLPKCYYNVARTQ